MQGVLNLTFYCFYPTQVRPEFDLTDYLIETRMICPLHKKDTRNPIYILQNMYNMQRRKDSSKPTKPNLKNQTKPNLPNKSYKTKPTETNLKNLLREDIGVTKTPRGAKTLKKPRRRDFSAGGDDYSAPAVQGSVHDPV